MKAKKILCLLLASAMLFSCALLFSACGKKDGYVTLSAKTLDVDLSEYSLVYTKAIGELKVLKNLVTEFGSSLSALAGVSIPVNTEDKTRSTADDPEILIGQTKREESQKAYNSIKGDGFVIEVKGNKIVIVGSNHLFTVCALQYFANNYIVADQAGDSVLTLHKKAKAKDPEMVVIATAEKTDYRYIYSDDLDDSVAHEYVHSAGGDHRDFPVVAVSETIAMLSKATGLANGKFPTRSDKSEKSTKEFLMGQVNREACAQTLTQLSETEYGIFIGDEDIVCTSYSDSGLMKCHEVFKGLIELAVFKDENDSPYVAFPKGFEYRGFVDDSWVTDFPKPEGEGIKLYNTADSNDNSLQYLYRGDGINAANYNAYCEKLKAEGYTLLTTHTAEDSIFSTFKNEAKGVALQVTYCAFKHADEFSYDKGEYHFVEPSFRIISAPLSSANLPDEALLTPNPSYVKVTDSKTTSVPLVTGAVGMGYVVTLEDGRFILFDGGFASNDGSPTHKKIWNILSALHKEITDKEPAADNPIRIAAWVVTHSHSDHYEAFEDFLGNYGKSGKVKMDYLLGNFPSYSSCYSVVGDIMHLSAANSVKGLQSLITGGFKFVKVHSGQKLYLANLEIEVLVTFEDLNPLRINNSNDTCTVLRFSLSNQDAPNAAPVTQVWTGDANRNQSRYMCAMYGSYLQSDMVQVAHHGNIGCEIPFYDCVNPTVVWFPHTAAAFRGYTAQGNQSSGWQYAVDYHLANNVPNVKYIYVSDTYHTTINLTVNGPDYENIYDVITGEKIPYDTTRIMIKN